MTYRFRRGTRSPAADPGSLPIPAVLIGTEGQIRTTSLRRSGDDLALTVDDLEASTGWQRTERGWCLGSLCVPVRDDLATATFLTLDEVVAELSTPAVVESGPAGTVVSFARPAPVVSTPASGAIAPDAATVDLAGRPTHLGRYGSRRRMLVFVASWCGCRDDLPAWQALAERIDENPSDGRIIVVAVDDGPADIAPFAGGVNLPILIDDRRNASEAYGIRNVPTVVWIDEHDRIARTNQQVFGDNRLQEHHGVDSLPHHEAFLRWVGGGPVEQPGGHVAAVTEADQWALAEFRLGAWLATHARQEDARRHLAEAAARAPENLAIARASIRLTGGDPFGPEFFELFERWRALSGGLAYLPPSAAS